MRLVFAKRSDGQCMNELETQMRTAGKMARFYHCYMVSTKKWSLPKETIQVIPSCWIYFIILWTSPIRCAREVKIIDQPKLVYNLAAWSLENSWKLNQGPCRQTVKSSGLTCGRGRCSAEVLPSPMRRTWSKLSKEHGPAGTNKGLAWQRLLHDDNCSSQLLVVKCS